MPAPKVLLANEAGIGRGHVVKLRAVAQALPPGLPLLAALARHKHADELTRIGARVISPPMMTYTHEAMANPRLEGNATWGDYLAAMGLARADHVTPAIEFWKRLIVAEDISVLITDYAPLAQAAALGLQAQGWQIAIISAGTGYGVPPADLPHFPQLLPDYSRSVHAEADIVALINAAGAPFGFPALPTFPAIYRADLPLPSTLPFLAPYRRWRDPAELLFPRVDRAPDLADTGDEVFVYFSTTELQDPEVMAALEALPLPRRGFLPGATDDQRARLLASGMILSETPLHVIEITRRSRMVLHSSQHGTLCMAAMAGLPQMGLPQHLEHDFHGRRAGQQGILDQLNFRTRSRDAIIDMAQTIYHSAPMRARATEFARELRAAHPLDAPDPLAQMLAATLERVGLI